MKNILLTLVSLLFVSVGFAGPRVVGNGLESPSDIFKRQGRMILNKIEETQMPVQFANLDNAIQNSYLKETKSSFSGQGLEKIVQAEPKQELISFNADEWLALPEPDQMTSVLHAYLNVMKIEDRGFQYSRMILKNIGSLPASVPTVKSTWLQCEGPTLSVSTLTYRLPGDSVEVTDVNLFFAGWLLQGQMKGAESTANLEAQGSGVQFKGNIYGQSGKTVDRLSVHGQFLVPAGVFNLDSELECKRMP